jgi:hypothetical protein
MSDLFTFFMQSCDRHFVNKFNMHAIHLQVFTQQVQKVGTLRAPANAL